MLNIAYGHQVVEQVEEDRIGPYANNQISIQALHQILSRHRPFQPKHARAQIEDPDQEYLLLTFDDGYRDNLHNLVPVLEEHDFHAFIFISTSVINNDPLPFETELAEIISRMPRSESPSEDRTDSTNQPLRKQMYNEIKADLKYRTNRARRAEIARLQNDHNISLPEREMMLSRDEIRKLDQHPLIKIGAHGHDHLVLDRMFPWVAHRDLKQSKKILERLLSRNVNMLAYPYGRCNWVTAQISKIAGFQQGFTTEEGDICSVDAFYSSRIPRYDLDDFVR